LSAQTVVTNAMRPAPEGLKTG